MECNHERLVINYSDIIDYNKKRDDYVNYITFRCLRCTQKINWFPAIPRFRDLSKEKNNERVTGIS